MSNLKKVDGFTNLVELWYSDEEKIGTFQMLDCDTHGTALSFSDKSGADNCIDCIKDNYMDVSKS